MAVQGVHTTTSGQLLEAMVTSPASGSGSSRREVRRGVATEAGRQAQEAGRQALRSSPGCSH